MMRRSILAASLLIALASPAFAQVYPNIPANSILGRLGAGQAGPPQPISLTQLLANLGPAAPLQINPAAGATQGLIVNQTLPTGTVNTTYNANQFTVTNPGYYSTASGLDSYGVIAGNDSGVRVNYTASGGVPTSIHIGFLSTAAEGSGSRPYQVIGLDGAAYSNVGSGTGSGTGDTIWGVIGYGNVGPSGKVFSSIAIEAESAVATGGQLSNRVAFSASSDGVGLGSAVDTAFLVSLGGAPDPTYGTPSAFKNLITIGVGSSHSGFGAGAGISSTGNIITADGDGTFTAACVICLPNGTFTTLFSFPNFTVTGAGALTTSGVIAETNSQNASTAITVTNTSAGTSAIAGFSANNGTGSAGFSLGGTGYTVISLLQNRAFINASSGAAGIVLNNQGNNPIIFSVSNAAVGQWQAGLQVGAPTGGDEGAGKINVQSGYYINGAAGLTQTCTVNQAKTLIFTLGILTGGTCNT